MGIFLGDSVVIAEEISDSSSSSEMLQKALVFVGSSSRNGCVTMLGLAVQSMTLLA